MNERSFDFVRSQFQGVICKLKGCQFTEAQYDALLPMVEHMAMMLKIAKANPWEDEE